MENSNIAEMIERRWAETMERLRAAQIASEEYCRATDPLYELEWTFRARVGIDAQSRQPDYVDRLNALRAANPAYFVPDFMNAHRDKLVDDLVDIEAELMAMPAPDYAALRWKLDKTSGDAWEPDFLTQMYRDMDRLLGPAYSLVPDDERPPWHYRYRATTQGAGEAA